MLGKAVEPSLLPHSSSSCPFDFIHQFGMETATACHAKKQACFRGYYSLFLEGTKKYFSVSTEAQACRRIFTYFRNTQKTQACFYICKVQIPGSGFITSWY